MNSNAAGFSFQDLLLILAQTGSVGYLLSGMALMIFLFSGNAASHLPRRSLLGFRFIYICLMTNASIMITMADSSWPTFWLAYYATISWMLLCLNLIVAEFHLAKKLWGAQRC